MEKIGNACLLNVIKCFSDTIWIYDAEKEQVFMHHDSFTPEMEGKWYLLDELSDLYHDRYLPETDLKVWERYLSKNAMHKFLRSEECSRSFSLRFCIGENVHEWHKVFMEKADEHRLLITSKNIHDNIRDRAVGKAVESEFDYVAYIRRDDLSYMLYYSNHENTPPMFGMNYHEELYSYNKKYVIEEEFEELTEKMRMENVLHMLERQEQYILYATLRYDDGSVAYKKLHFCFLDEDKDILLLLRMDITDITKEHKLRLAAEKKEKEAQKKLASYLDHMPVAYCTIRVLLDEEGDPYDFVFTYSNHAHSTLETKEDGELVGQSFLQLVHDADVKWLEYYYDTACNGVPHIIERYSNLINKQVMVYTFQPEYGYCGCVVLDITEQRQLEKAVNMNQQRIQRLLYATADFIFQYDPEIDSIQQITIPESYAEHEKALKISDYSGWIPLEDILVPKHRQQFREAAAKLNEENTEISFTIKGGMIGLPDRWFNVTIFAFLDYELKKNLILGYMQDIHSFIMEKKYFQKEAESDPLTGILNTKFGRIRSEELVGSSGGNQSYLMFIFDIDDFKTINDTMGHLEGDKVLIGFAGVLNKVFRQNDVVFRLGGDEFAAFVSTAEDGRKVAENILDRFSGFMESISCDGSNVSSSAGVFISRRKEAFNYYYRHADEALYETKGKGKNSYTIKCDSTEDE